MLRFLACLLGPLPIVLFTAAVSAAAEPTLDYNRDIRPILSETCFPCHGFDERAREADLRLDLADAAYQQRDGTTPIVPGNPQGSEVWRRIISEDPDLQMPPPDSKRSLDADQRARIRRWIEEGARYAGHWSFTPPAKVPLPDVSRPDWVRNEIDRFVLAKLDQQGWQPSAEADRATLIRRLSQDLTGLPPTWSEVEAFVQDRSEHAYEALVERLLKSPHFGERLALDWLDAARYADTNGFSIDGGRHMWLWRDWVIHAFNSNMPYDQFLRDQLAGDLVPGASPAQLVATGFQRNNMVTHEGGTIPAENLANYNADRVKTLGEAVLGLTLGCGQCHNHKYDPITQVDYYRLVAYFNSVSDIGLDGNAGVNPRPFVTARTVLQTGEEPELRGKLAQLRQRLAEPDDAEVTRWAEVQMQRLAERGKDLQLLPVELLKVSTPNRGSGFEIADGLVQISEPSDLVAYDIALRLPDTARPITGVRVIFHPEDRHGGGWGYGPAERRPKKRPVRAAAARKVEPAQAGQANPDTEPAFKGNFVLTAFSASADVVAGDQVNLHRLLPVRQVTASSWQASYPPDDCLDTRNQNGWSPDLTAEGPVHLTVTFDEAVRSEAEPFLTVQLNFGHGKSLVASRMEVQAMTGSDDGSPLPTAVIEALQTHGKEAPAGDSAGAQDRRQVLREYYAQHAEPTRPLRVAIANLEERLAVLTQEFPTMVMDVAPQPRETFVLYRGDYAQPRDRVTAGTPAALPPLPPDAPSDRRGLAEWVTMRTNPLTARVAVNRFWQLLFGVGIVKTTADFGAQGEWPSHPELLDWLAVDFQESGWRVKELIRKIVLSATYRQASSATPVQLEQDPENRWLARGPRFRLPAELIRDGALRVSGLLVPQLGGPSVNPYMPADLWREISHYGSTPATAQSFVQDHGDKLYRRSLYTYWKRTAPPPNMAAFDAPSREVCVVSRPGTTTPLQALVLLNDIQFVEAARAFAQRMLVLEADDVERLRWGVRECLSRDPQAYELETLVRVLERERQRYQRDPAAAEQYLRIGESPRDESFAAPEHAAWAQVATVLLNLSETITRN